MKYIFILLLAACSMEPKVPCACQRNLHDCLSAYEEDKEMFCVDHEPCTHEEWNRLCHQDLNVCRSG